MILTLHIRLLVACVLCVLPGSATAMDQPVIHQLKAGDRVLVLGDSTTADGVQIAGHVRLVDQALQEQAPELKASVSGAGWVAKPSGSLLGKRPNNDSNNVENLSEGMIGRVIQTAIAKGQGPTVVLINLGLNDQRLNLGTEQYAQNLRAATTHIRALGVTVILCTPTTMRGIAMMEPYAKAVRELATELKCPVIDLHAVHVDHIVAHTRDGKLDPAESPTRDACHLSGVGEGLSARAMLQAFGLKPVWKQYQLRAQVGADRGTLAIDPQLPLYPPGTEVTLALTVKPGFTFKSWTLDATGTELTTKVVMDRHRVISANIIFPR